MEYRLEVSRIIEGIPVKLARPAHVEGRSTGAWWRVLLAALLLYLVGLASLAVTRNLKLFPAVVILGSSAVPVAYVAFFYQRKYLSRLTMSTTSIGFFFGGILGVYATALLENRFFIGPDVVINLEASLIEEGVKMVCVLLVARRLRHDSEVDGIILGAAVGMGFAALESIGYAFTTFFYSQGSPQMTAWVTRQTGGIVLTPTLMVTLVRGMLSPMAHGTWTAILAGVLFRQSRGNHFRLDAQVIWACLLVIALHGLWDAMPDAVATLTPSRVVLLVAEAVIGAAGLLILSAPVAGSRAVGCGAWADRRRAREFRLTKQAGRAPTPGTPGWHAYSRGVGAAAATSASLQPRLVCKYRRRARLGRELRSEPHLQDQRPCAFKNGITAAIYSSNFSRRMLWPAPAMVTSWRWGLFCTAHAPAAGSTAGCLAGSAAMMSAGHTICGKMPL